MGIAQQRVGRSTSVKCPLPRRQGETCCFGDTYGPCSALASRPNSVESLLPASVPVRRNVPLAGLHAPSVGRCEDPQLGTMRRARNTILRWRDGMEAETAKNKQRNRRSGSVSTPGIRRASELVRNRPCRGSRLQCSDQGCTGEYGARDSMHSTRRVAQITPTRSIPKADPSADDA
ncbi:MAG: hypothetical protein RL291_1750 [Pseudomonadota bacterium]